MLGWCTKSRQYATEGHVALVTDLFRLDTRRFHQICANASCTFGDVLALVRVSSDAFADFQRCYIMINQRSSLFQGA